MDDLCQLRESGIRQPVAATEVRYAFSVIIPTLNEEKSIAGCLESLRKQAFAREAFEVIVVDNGSTDRTTEIARSFADSLEITVLALPQARIAGLRNAGAQVAQGRILAFLDADMLVPPGWLMEAEKIFSSDVGIVGGNHLLPGDSSWVTRVWFGRRKIKNPEKVSYIPSGDLMVSHANFLLIGGFDERLETNEDAEFCLRARALGLPLRKCESIAVVHLGFPQTVRDFFRRETWHGTSVVRVFLRNIRSFQNGKVVFFAAYMLACVLGLVTGTIYGATSGHYSFLLYVLVLALALPGLLGVNEAWARGSPEDSAPLTLLYLVYGLARALSLARLAVGLDTRRGALPGRSAQEQP